MRISLFDAAMRNQVDMTKQFFFLTNDNNQIDYIPVFIRQTVDSETMHGIYENAFVSLF